MMHSSLPLRHHQHCLASWSAIALISSDIEIEAALLAIEIMFATPIDLTNEPTNTIDFKKWNDLTHH
jgi:hypothetical protein